MYRSLILLAVSLLFFYDAGAQNRDAEAGRQAFDNYKSAILNDQGDVALNYIDSRTKKFYRVMLHAARDSDSATVAAMSLLDRITIFSVRHRAGREEIVGMTGDDLFVYAVKNGMVAKNGVVRNSIGKVTIDKDFATGQIVIDGRPTPLVFNFYVKAGQWKLD